MLIYCGVRGLIDSNTGTILSSTTFGWENIPLRQLLTDRYSVPVIDLYAQSGISPFLPEHRELYMPDGLHYSPAGYERLAHRIAAGLTAVCR